MRQEEPGRGGPFERGMSNRAAQGEVAAAQDDDRGIGHLEHRTGRGGVGGSHIHERRHRAVPEGHRERRTGLGRGTRGHRGRFVAAWDQGSSGRGFDGQPVQGFSGCARSGLEPVRDPGARLRAEPEDRRLIAGEIHQAGTRAAGQDQRACRGEHGRAGAAFG